MPDSPGLEALFVRLYFDRHIMGRFNIRDFAPLHESWQSAGRPHAGIIVSQQLGSRQYRLLLERMVRLLNHFSAEQMVGNFVHLEQFK